MPYERFSRESGSTKVVKTTPPLAGAPEDSVTMNHRGFTLVEIIMVVFVLGMLLAIGIPNYLRARTETQKNLCINNLRVLDAAKEEWALTDRKTQGEPVNEDEVNALLKTGTPHCPAGGHYAYGAVGSTPKCSLAATYGHLLPDPGEQLNPRPQEPEVAAVGIPSPPKIVPIQEPEMTRERRKGRIRFTAPRPSRATR